MLKAYFNYPNPHVTIHHDPDCGLIQPHKKPDQRLFRINVSNATEVLRQFVDQEVAFAAKKNLNDMWLEVDFDNRAYEIATVLYIQYLFGRRYKPLATARVIPHCEVVM